MDARPQVLFDDQGRKVKLEGVPMPRYLDDCRVDIITGVVRTYAVVYEDAVPPEVRANVESLCKLSNRVAGAKRFDAVAWPMRPLYADKEGRDFKGYTLRKPPATGASFDLVFLNPQRYSTSIPGDRRIAVLQSLCDAMDAIHGQDRVMGRLDDRFLVLRDDKDAVGIIHFDLSGTSHAIARDAYLAPEVAAPSVPVSDFTRETDYYALAVVIYRMFANGALPAYGASGEVPSSPIPASFPDYLTDMFVRALVEGAENPSMRPTAQEWSKVLVRFGKDVRQCTTCGAHWFWRWRVTCPYCAEEAATRAGLRSLSESGDTDGEGQTEEGALSGTKMPPEPLKASLREALGSLECDAGQVIVIEGERYQVLGSCRLRKEDSYETGRSPFASTDVGAVYCILYLSRLSSDGGAAGKDSEQDDAWLLVDKHHGVCELLFHGRSRSKIGRVDEGGCRVVETDGWKRKGMREYDLFERGVAADGSTAFNLIEKKRKLTGMGDDSHWETIKVYTHLAGHRLDVEEMRMEGRPRPQAVSAEAAKALDEQRPTGESVPDAGSGKAKASPKKTLIVCGLVACVVFLLVLGKGGTVGVSNFLFEPVEEPAPFLISRFDTLYSSDSFPYEKPAVPPYGADTYGSYRDVDEVVDQVLESVGDDVQAMARDDESGAVGILTDRKYVFVYPNAGADGNGAGDSDFTREDAERLLGSVGDMYEAGVRDSEEFETFALCCDRTQAYRTDLRPYNASWRAYYWYRVFYRAMGWAQDSDGASAASSYEHYTGPTEIDV